MSNTTGSTIISALEGLYAQAHAKHPDLPRNLIFVTGSGRGTAKGMIKYGHWAEGRWSARADSELPASVHELLISGECLAGGVETVLTTVLHEAAHALATSRGVKDTSRGNRYHNKKFVALAEELGMHYPHEAPHGTIGWSAVELREDTAEAYDLTDLDRAIQAGIDMTVSTEPTPPKKQRQVIECTFTDGTTVELGLKKYEELSENLTEHVAALVIK